MDRKLAAILAADIVGFSRMMGVNEQDTVSAIRKLRSELLDPVISEYSGSILKSMGDGCLVEFTSAVSAVNAAMQVQDRLSDDQSLLLRIGVHIGDITHTADDFYGDGVNIASRLEGLAPDGGILISDAVYSSLDEILSPSFEDGGVRRLKNIAREVATCARKAAPKSHNCLTQKTRGANAAFPVLSVIPVKPRRPMRLSWNWQMH